MDDSKDQIIKKLQKEIVELTKQKDMFDDIMNHIPGHVYWLDKNNIYLGCNTEHAQTVGLKNKSDIVGKSNFDMPWKNIAKEVNATNNEVMRTQRPHIIKESAIINGIPTVYLSSKVPLRNKDNHVIGILGISINITKEENLNKQLNIAKQKAEAADRAKAEFIANMSHDIRTPLTGIIGLSNIVENQSHEEEIKEYAHMLNMSGERLLSLLNSVLEIVAADSIGHKSLRLTTFNLEDLLHSIFELELPSLELKSIDFKLDMDEALPKFIESDKEKIYRIILNILSNAIKFTHDGSITIKTRLIEEKGDTLITRILVIDTGIGIPKEDISKVFDQFYRASPAHEGKFDGYGVGLHIVQKYLKLLKGEVLVESEVGKGTCISLTLPLKKASVPQECKKPEHPIKETTLSPKTKVLLVEDDNMARLVAKTMLTNAQCQVLEATNSTDAYALFIKHHFDFVLTDIGLPDFSGLELSKKIRQFEFREQRPQTPIIALSGHADVDNLPIYEFKYGLSDMYTKPLRQDNVATLLNLYEPKNKVTHETTKPLLDIELATSQLGSIDMVKEMAQMMLDDAFVNIIPNIDKHFHAQEWELFKKQVHKFKSSCLYCATLPLLEIVQKLESLADGKKLDDIAPVYDQFLSCAEQTRQFIKSWL